MGHRSALEDGLGSCLLWLMMGWTVGRCFQVVEALVRVLAGLVEAAVAAGGSAEVDEDEHSVEASVDAAPVQRCWAAA